MNYSDVIELLDFVELFEPDWTVRQKSDYSIYVEFFEVFFFFIYLFIKL